MEPMAVPVLGGEPGLSKGPFLQIIDGIPVSSGDASCPELMSRRGVEPGPFSFFRMMYRRPVLAAASSLSRATSPSLTHFTLQSSEPSLPFQAKRLKGKTLS